MPDESETGSGIAAEKPRVLGSSSGKAVLSRRASYVLNAREPGVSHQPSAAREYWAIPGGRDQLRKPATLRIDGKSSWESSKC